MRAAPKRRVPWALLACGLVSASTHAAPDGAFGGDSELSNQPIQKPEPAGVAENARRATTGRNVAIGRSEATARDANSRNSAFPGGPQTAKLQGAGIKPRDHAIRLTGAHANAPSPAVAVHQHPVKPLGAAAARGAGATAAPFYASRRVSGAVPVANGRTSTLKALAGNGVIGGPHDSTRGTLGGAASATHVINRSIDGAALRHRS